MDTIKTIIITNDPIVAAEAQEAGVTRIMVDLEITGKKERQASRTTFISAHQKEDIAKIRSVLKTSQLIVRINPWNADSPAEIDHAIAAGADIVMLPMITHISHVDAFLAHLAGRAKAMPLIETAYSMAHISDMAANPKIDELYIGLNDLHLSLGLDFLFEPLAMGLIDWMAQKIKAQGKTFGFGGIAMLGSGELPAESILGEHARLGSTCVILSSRFCKDVHMEDPMGRKERLKEALMTMQGAYRKLRARTENQQQSDSIKAQAIIKTLAAAARKRSMV